MALAPITKEELQRAWPDADYCDGYTARLRLGTTMRPQHLHNNNSASIIYTESSDELGKIMHFKCRVELSLGAGFHTDFWVHEQHEQPDLVADRLAIAAAFKEIFLPLLEPQEKAVWH